VEVAVAIAQRAEQVTGLAAVFIADSTGHYGGVRWLIAYPNIAAVEGAQQAINTDQALVDRLESAAGLYADHPGTTNQAIYRQVR